MGLAALGLWLCALAVITAVFEPSRTVAVVGPFERTLAALEGTDARIVNVGSGFITVRSEQHGLVRRLYAQGAWLVLPARAGGCMRVDGSGGG